MTSVTALIEGRSWARATSEGHMVFDTLPGVFPLPGLVPRPALTAVVRLPL
jgi:hypothetical protein